MRIHPRHCDMIKCKCNATHNSRIIALAEKIAKTRWSKQELHRTRLWDALNKISSKKIWWSSCQTAFESHHRNHSGSQSESSSDKWNNSEILAHFKCSQHNLRDAMRVRGMWIDYTSKKSESVSNALNTWAATCTEPWQSSYAQLLELALSITLQDIENGSGTSPLLACIACVRESAMDSSLAIAHTHFLAHSFMPTKATPRHINREMIAVQVRTIFKANSGQHKSHLRSLLHKRMHGITTESEFSPKWWVEFTFLPFIWLRMPFSPTVGESAF